MPLLTYLVTAEAAHQSGKRLPTSVLDDQVTDWVADAVHEAVAAASSPDEEPTFYRAEQVTVEPIAADRYPLPLALDDWRRLHDALDVAALPAYPDADPTPDRLLVERLATLITHAEAALVPKPALEVVPDA